MKAPVLVAVAALVVSYIPDALAQGKPKGAEEGCDTACRAARNNPRPKFVSPEVSPDGRVTVRVYSPKADSVGVAGLEPLNENGESAVVPATKGEDGVWSYTSPARKPGVYAYSVRIDGVDSYDPSNLWIVAGRQKLENVVEIGGGEDFARNDPSIPHGAVAEVFYRTPVFNFDRRMRVYTPPNYGAKQETLPILFLLHGGSGSEDTWGKLGRANFILDNLIAQGKAKRMIAVMVDGYVDDFSKVSGVSPDLTNDDIMKGIIPYLEANYMVSKDPKDRAVAGQSRGAAQTFTIARKYPDQFAYVGVFSFSRSRVGGFRKEMDGLKTDADWKSFGDMVNKHKYFYWTVGTEDGGEPDSKAVWELYKKNNIKVVSETRPGNHEWLVWRPALRDFAQKIFQ
jgi:enterochelin esterase family protein